MNFKLVTPPSTYPVTLAQVKEHLRLPASYTSEDNTLQIYLDAAVKTAEDRTNRALLAQTWRVSFDYFTPVLTINKTPLISVTHLKYYDVAGDIQTLDPSKYIVDADNEPFRITSIPGITFPSVQKRINAITVTFQAGYASAALVPKNIISGILLIVDDLYKQRGSTIVGYSVNNVPLTADKLFESERVIWL